MKQPGAPIISSVQRKENKHEHQQWLLSFKRAEFGFGVGKQDNVHVKSQSHVSNACTNPSVALLIFQKAPTAFICNLAVSSTSYVTVLVGALTVAAVYLSLPANRLIFKGNTFSDTEIMT